MEFEAIITEENASETELMSGTAENSEVRTPEEASEEQPKTDISADEDELKEKFPALEGKSIDELTNKERYMELRALGLSPEEAFFATAKKRGGVKDNRAHLFGTFPKSVHAPSCGMSASELSEARELFRGISDEEIRNLYRRVTK